MDYFSFEDVMKELELGEEELKRMVSEGELRAFRDENKMKFKKEDVESLKKGRITEPTIILPSTPSSETTDETVLDLDIGQETAALSDTSAQLAAVGGKGRREIPVEQVATGPGQTSLAADEFVTEIKLPARPARSADAYLRSIPRTEMDIAVVGAGVCLTLDAGGKITAARVALGAVAPTALLVPEAAAAIVGTTLDEAALDALDAAARAAARPIADKRGTVDYRIKIAGVLARRAARIAYERAEARA